jgi:hypothetical protein
MGGRGRVGGVFIGVSIGHNVVAGRPLLSPACQNKGMKDAIAIQIAVNQIGPHKPNWCRHNSCTLALPLTFTSNSLAIKGT